MLGDLLRARREARSLSLSEAASGINVTKTHLYGMENGLSNNPTLTTIVALMAYYKISWTELITAWKPK